MKEKGDKSSVFMIRWLINENSDIGENICNKSVVPFLEGAVGS